jgi:hypothetical protein
VDHRAVRTEIFLYDTLNRMSLWSFESVPLDGSPPAGFSIDYAYDPAGNLLKKEAVAQRFGPPEATGPNHLVKSGDDTRFAYDAVGRAVTYGDRKLAYTGFDFPKTVTTPAGTTIFKYSAPPQRALKNGASGRTLYVAGLYEQRQPPGGQRQHLFSIGDVAHVVRPGRGDRGAEQVLYLHRDHLGSIDAVTTCGRATLRAARLRAVRGPHE